LGREGRAAFLKKQQKTFVNLGLWLFQLLGRFRAGENRLEHPLRGLAITDFAGWFAAFGEKVVDAGIRRHDEVGPAAGYDLCRSYKESWEISHSWLQYRGVVKQEFFASFFQKRSACFLVL
jgi:hypothetical protein